MNDLLDERSLAVSRSARRKELISGKIARLEREAESLAETRAAALERIDRQARGRAAKLAERRWVLPLDLVQVTAEFGESGPWSNSHTGIDLNSEEGDPIRAIAGGSVTSASYDGAYGNKTVVTSKGGTELWYCHQSAFAVSRGDDVAPGELIGYVGSTGNVTGSHLHVEVRPKE